MTFDSKIERTLKSRGISDFKPIRFKEETSELFGGKEKAWERKYAYLAETGKTLFSIWDISTSNKYDLPLITPTGTGLLLIEETECDYVILDKVDGLRDGSKYYIVKYYNEGTYEIITEIKNIIEVNGCFVFNETLFDIEPFLQPNAILEIKCGDGQPLICKKSDAILDIDGSGYYREKYLYYGSYKDKIIIWSNEANQYEIIDSSGEVTKTADGFWCADDGTLCSYLIDFSSGHFKFHIFDVVSGECVIGFERNVRCSAAIKKHRIFSEKNYFVFEFEFKERNKKYLLTIANNSLAYWGIIDTSCSDYYCEVYGFKNGIIVIEKGFNFDLYDIYFNRLTVNSFDLAERYIKVNKKLIRPSSQSHNEYVTRYGVVKLDDLSLIMPIEFEDIRILREEPYLVTIVEKTIVEEGKTKKQYELYRDGRLSVGIDDGEIVECDGVEPEYNRIKKDGKYGLLRGDVLLTPIDYDKIDIVRRLIERADEWIYYEIAFLHKKRKMCLFVPDSNYQSKMYFNITAFSPRWEKATTGDILYFADNVLISYASGIEKKLVELPDNWSVLASNEKYFILESKRKQQDGKYKYLCYDFNGKSVKIKDTNYCPGRNWEYRKNNVFFAINSEFIYDITGRKWVPISEEEEESEYSTEPYYEEPDYDEATYYALGGTDYDKFKENGGDIDDMMDNLGL